MSKRTDEEKWNEKKNSLQTSNCNYMGSDEKYEKFVYASEILNDLPRGRTYELLFDGRRWIVTNFPKKKKNY